MRAVRRHQRGFTYVMMLAAVAVLAITAGAAGTVTSRRVQADKEAELLFRGQAYARAIGGYYEAAEELGDVKRYPRRLEDLVKDPRFVHRRHIRRVYEHPIDEREWVLLRGPGGGIRGVASPSREEPLKKANFPPGLESFAGAGSYNEWLFIYEPRRDAPRTR
ncbi:MAG: type II secretion system protein [Gammaproteobacteria bacterium]|nr:type II secretion system protein [Gammaproteobacteria bacterium]NIR58696.1 type II secretion system protein [Gammaproteobacteria bacterium]NIR90357.1 type II secretion system protein [Gammaproteobacteria bacterium]